MTERERSVSPLLLALTSTGFLAVLLWMHWPSLTNMVGDWSSDPKYTHGYLVPAFSLGLLWIRRDRLASWAPRPSIWGVVLITIAAAVFFLGGMIVVPWFQGLALVLALLGWSVLVGGWTILKWTGPSVLFLVFMLPLPGRVETMLGLPLQSIATRCGVVLLQLLGVPAVNEGNTILLTTQTIEVAEACNGLAMLITFVAIATAFAIVIDRPAIDKALIVVSSIPIAIVCNVARITLTGYLHEKVGERIANLVFHDLAGWLLMPLALLLLWWELIYLSRLFPSEERLEVPFTPAFQPSLADGASSPSRRDSSN